MLNDDKQLDDAIAQVAREIEPERDLWPAIETRLPDRWGSRWGSRGRSRWGTRRSDSWAGGLVLAMAASAVLYVGVSNEDVTKVVRETTGAHEPEPLAVRDVAALPGSSAETALAVGALAKFGAAEAHPWILDYETAVFSLETIFRAQRDTLEPSVFAVVNDNLAVVDEAIERSRSALDAEPESPLLLAVVQDAYQDKLELLDQASGLVDGMNR